MKVKQIQKKIWSDVFAENVNLNMLIQRVCGRKKNEVSDEILQGK